MQRPAAANSVPNSRRPDARISRQSRLDTWEIMTWSAPEYSGRLSARRHRVCEDASQGRMPTDNRDAVELVVDARAAGPAGIQELESPRGTFRSRRRTRLEQERRRRPADIVRPARSIISRSFVRLSQNATMLKDCLGSWGIHFVRRR